MRAAFVDHADVYYGPSSPFGPPGALYLAAIDCRYVPQTRIAQRQAPFDLSGAWLTYNVAELNGPDVISPWAPATFEDYLTADQVVVARFPLDRFVICRQEYVHPFVGGDYWRSLLIHVDDLTSPPWLPPQPLPPPPVPPAVCPVPGAACLVAGFLPYGISCPYPAPVGMPQWFQVSNTIGVPLVFTFNVTAGVVQFEVLAGLACGGLAVVYTNVGPGSPTLVFGPADIILIRVTGLFPLSTFTVSCHP